MTQGFHNSLISFVGFVVGCRTQPFRACPLTGKKGESFRKVKILFDHDDGLALMPFGNSEMNVPEGQMKIAQRFIAGCLCANETSPVRDERNRLFGDTLLSPRGLCRLGIRNCRLGIRNPRLKPWAGLLSGCPCGTNFRRIFERHSD